MIPRRVNLILGILGVVAFLATGQYMDRRFDHLRGMADAPRLLFRSAHIYLLFSSLLNLLVGAYWAPGRSSLRRGLQGIGSVLVGLGPIVFIVAFLREPWLHDLARPFARLGIYASFAGVLLHVAGNSRSRTTAQPAVADGGGPRKS
jgi:hypothetical protein